MSLYEKDDPAAKSYIDLREYFGNDENSQENLEPSKNSDDFIENSDEEIPLQASITYKRKQKKSSDNSETEPFPGSESDYVPDSYIESTTSEEGTPRGKRHVKKFLASLEDKPSYNSSETSMSVKMSDNILKSRTENILSSRSTTLKNEAIKKSLANDTENEISGVTVHDENALTSRDCIITKSNNEPGIRKWDKKHACLYCFLLVTKLPRHLESKHANEKEIIEFLQFPKGSLNRKKKIEFIRQLGNYAHNSKVLAQGKGDIIPKKRSKKERDIKNMAPCKACFGLYAKKDLYVHYRKCTQVQGIDMTKKYGSIFPVQDADKELQEQIFSNMRQDAIYLAITQDRTIVKFGSMLYQQHRAQPHLKSYVSQRMRQLGRLLLEVRKINPDIKNIAQLIHPANFENFIAAVHIVAGFKDDNSYNIPSLALRLRSSIQQCADILKSESIKELLFERRKEVEGFVELINMNFTRQVATHALNTVYTKKWNKTTVLPLAEDLKKLTEYLKKRATELIQDLKTSPTSGTWSELCDITMVQTLIFNRRRPGEVERIFLQTYLNRDTVPLSEELLNSLSDVEKHLCETLTRFETRGKRGRKVPILLTKEFKNQIDLLNLTRKEVIPVDNIYLFASLNSTSFKRSAKILKKFVLLSDVADPDAITSTKLRKQVATACQLLNLPDNEMDQLATYMGHDIRVHREFYRLPDSSVQVSKVSKLLLSLEKGSLLKNKGKNFDNINVDASDTEKEMSENEIDNIQTLSHNRKSESETDIEKQTEDGINKTHKDTKVKKMVKRKFGKNKNKKKEWSNEEKDAMCREMALFWIRKKVPNKADCEKCIKNEPILKERTWRQIKYYVHNVIQKNRKSTK